MRWGGRRGCYKIVWVRKLKVCLHRLQSPCRKFGYANELATRQVARCFAVSKSPGSFDELLLERGSLSVCDAYIIKTHPNERTGFCDDGDELPGYIQHYSVI
jgi:hypothetical protein